MSDLHSPKELFSRAYHRLPNGLKTEKYAKLVRNHLEIVILQDGTVWPLKYLTWLNLDGDANASEINPPDAEVDRIRKILKNHGWNRPRKPEDALKLYEVAYHSSKLVQLPKTSKWESRERKFADGSLKLLVQEPEDLNDTDGSIDASFDPEKSAFRDKVIEAMDLLAAGDSPDGFRKPKIWFVFHPESHRSYPAKMVWGLATKQRGMDFTSHSARNAMRKLGFTVEKISQIEDAERPEDILETPSGNEGAVRQVTRNEYERCQWLRELCVAFYRQKDDGRLLCQSCGFDFEATYGEVGEGFIHIHHLDPLGNQQKEHLVDPKRDLVPLCPNCHAMSHRRLEKGQHPRLPEELRQLRSSLNQ